MHEPSGKQHAPGTWHVAQFVVAQKTQFSSHSTSQQDGTMLHTNAQHVASLQNGVACGVQQSPALLAPHSSGAQARLQSQLTLSKYSFWPLSHGNPLKTLCATTTRTIGCTS